MACRSITAIAEQVSLALIVVVRERRGKKKEMVKLKKWGFWIDEKEIMESDLWETGKRKFANISTQPLTSFYDKD